MAFCGGANVGNVRLFQTVKWLDFRLAACFFLDLMMEFNLVLVHLDCLKLSERLPFAVCRLPLRNDDVATLVAFAIAAATSQNIALLFQL